MDANWHPDPTGRFGQRYFDGSAWTEHVLGASGQTVADPLSQTYPPPPPGSAVTSIGGPAGAGAPVATGPRRTSWYGLGVAGVGVLFILLSLFVLNWADDTSASDIRSDIPDSLDGVNLEDVITFRYIQWVGSSSCWRR